MELSDYRKVESKTDKMKLRTDKKLTLADTLAKEGANRDLPAIQTNYKSVQKGSETQRVSDV